MQASNTIRRNKTKADNWKQNSETYTGDDLIDAFIRGKKAGRDEQKKVLLERLRENIIKAQELSENLFNKAQEEKIKLYDIHLKADNISSFTALFIADKSDFLSDNFRKIYTAARIIKNKAETETFYITFSFTPKSDRLSEDCLAADGFFMKYEKEKSRKA